MNRTHRARRWLAVAAVTGAVVAAMAAAPGVSQAAGVPVSSPILGCHPDAGTPGLYPLSVSTTGNCTNTTSKLTWNLTGPPGLQGATGLQGPAGPRDLPGHRAPPDLRVRLDHRDPPDR